MGALVWLQTWKISPCIVLVAILKHLQINYCGKLQLWLMHRCIEIILHSIHQEIIWMYNCIVSCMNNKLEAWRAGLLKTQQTGMTPWRPEKTTSSDSLIWIMVHGIKSSIHFFWFHQSQHLWNQQVISKTVTVTNKMDHLWDIWIT